MHFFLHDPKALNGCINDLNWQEDLFSRIHLFCDFPKILKAAYIRYH